MNAGQGDGGRRGYHHGNLRQALVDASISLIEERGSTAFTFAEVARKAEVTPAAPYRHFKDRDALLAEIARIGFIALAEVLEEAWSSAQPSAIRAFDAVTAGYLDFACRERAFFAVMFQTDFTNAGDIDLRDANARVFEVLERSCSGLIRTRGSDVPVSMVSHHVWALCHGVATLFGRPEPGRPIPMPAGEMLEAATGVYLRGLGLIE
ncbi:MAG: TetR/AcrR family transcriptional regulator [Pseudomonadota bacterium]